MDESTKCVVLLLLIWAPVVRGDFPCLCCYSLETAVYQEKALSAGSLGYMYEFDCKPLYEPLPSENTWTAIQFEQKIGYVQMTQDQVIQQCPGSIPTGDQVNETPPAATSTTRLSSTLSPITQPPATPPQTTQPFTQPQSTRSPTTQTTSTQSSTTESIKTNPPTHDSITTQTITTNTHTTQPITTYKHSTSKPVTQSPTTDKAITQQTTGIQPMTTQPPSSTTTSLKTVKQSTIHTTQSTAHPSLTTTHTQLPLKTTLHTTTHMPSWTQIPANSCPPNVVTHASQHHGYVMSRGDSCFELVNNALYWHGAEGSCRHRGGHLTSIKNQAEENALLVFMYHHGVKHDVWIGLTDQLQEHHFTWSSGLPLSWTNWIPGHQNHFMNNHDDCVALFPNVSMVSASHSNSVGTWDDVHCNIQKPFICRFEAHQSWHLIG